MRAMYNPSRMTVIQKTQLKLVEKINSVVLNVISQVLELQTLKGLKCSLCRSVPPTLSYIYTCQHCQYTKKKCTHIKKQTEDPCMWLLQPITLLRFSLSSCLRTQLLFRLFMDYFKIYKPHNTVIHLLTLVHS
jgi:hypothetical protein